jgi:hypothetical protein
MAWFLLGLWIEVSRAGLVEKAMHTSDFGVVLPTLNYKKVLYNETDNKVSKNGEHETGKVFWCISCTFSPFQPGSPS